MLLCYFWYFFFIKKPKRVKLRYKYRYTVHSQIYIVYNYDIDNNCNIILSNTMREFIESEIFINETGLYLELIDSSFLLYCDTSF